MHDSAVPLNPDHTHFIFVDDGYRIRYDGVAAVRSQLEQTISAPVNGKYDWLTSLFTIIHKKSNEPKHFVPV